MSDIDNSSKYTELRVRAKTVVTESLFKLELERGGISFKPGDCLAVFDAVGVVSRPYSICSGVNEDSICFMIRALPDGLVSTYLQNCNAGDVVKVSPPFGWFRPGQNIGEAPFVFIATGTGIAPFVSYRHSFPDRPPSCCLYGVRFFAEAVAYRSLSGWCPLHLAVSREKPDEFDHFQGRLNGLLDKVPLSADTHYYLCGADTMISEVSEWLEQREIDIFNIHREVFFYDCEAD